MERMEHVRRPMIEGVRLQAQGGRAPPIEGGTICITPFFLVFSHRKRNEEDITVLHTSISNMDHKVGSSVVVICLKDFRRINLEFSFPEDCKDFVDALEVLSKPENLDQLYGFTFQLHMPPPPSGWGSMSADELLSRWSAEDRFRICNVNKGFKVCPSYPEEVVVPSSVSDMDVFKVSHFRHGHRFPIVCFHHHLNKAVLVKCGQPLCGHTHKKLKEDVSMLNAYLPSRSRGKIMDIRPHSVANQHMSKGGGMELPEHYPQWKVEHAKIESPAVLQTSFTKLLEACYDPSLSTSSSWFGRLESSGWLSHVTRLLEYSRKIALAIHSEACSVVVHGAMSRDATLQLTALSQVLLDYRCRTMAGFAELVEREWLDGGHQFSMRHRHVTSAPEKESAPVFLLFLDAVWQVMQQFPFSFEFNERFLHTLLVHSYSSPYTNFLYDTPKERVTNKLKEKTYSLWDYLAVAENCKSMLNPLYEKNSSVLLITVTALNVTLWRRLYLRTDLLEQLQLPGYEALRLLKEENSSRKERLKDVKRELESLQVQGRKYASNFL